MNNIVIVESPAKAKTINNYLGGNYQVLASYGHIRDLPPKDGSVRPDENFAMDWEITGSSKNNIKAIADAAKNASGIFLATDPDREGEAISWHVLEELKKRKVLDDTKVKRVTFNAITKVAVLDAMENPRDLNEELIDAYLARRALDYLVGFKLSPVLWRKIPGSRSAGRVQSVALRLICDRELEIEKFESKEYWSIKAKLITSNNESFDARLTHLDNQKLEKFTITNEKDANVAKEKIESSDLHIDSIDKKKKRRKPYAPFTTSTLQQESARRLYFSAKKTMDIAQKLYEGFNINGENVGLITYMRTDGVQIDSSAIDEIRNNISEIYGKNYLPEKRRVYATKAKNAQEAHEAIRPTLASRTPDKVKELLTKEQLQLYTLIWNRTIASQMSSAELDQVTLITCSEDKKIKLRSTGSVITFPGFLKVYKDPIKENNKENENDTDEDVIIPSVQVSEKISQEQIIPNQHFTAPPPRYSEASLVKTMEELGIGRPSTYASIIQVLQDRNYVKSDNRRFIPEDRGRVVTAFLQSFFSKYVEYSFTAELENKLDEISDGKLNWKEVLLEFWSDFIVAIEETSKLRITEVIDTLDELLEPHLFPNKDGESNSRKCPNCKDGDLSLKFGKFGGFIGCKNYPECRFTRQLSITGQTNEGPKDLGLDPQSGLNVSLRTGPYGLYVQLGETENPIDEKKSSKQDSKDKKKKKKTKPPKPKRSSVPRDIDPETIDLTKALKILSLPREVGRHPESGEMILAGIGRFGPYLKYGDSYQSIPRNDDVLEIGLNRAVVVIAEGKNKKGRGANTSSKNLGKHPDDGKAVNLKEGRFGPYVQHGSLRATLPKDIDKESVKLSDAIDLLIEKSKKAKSKKKTNSRKKSVSKNS